MSIKVTSRLAPSHAIGDAWADFEIARQALLPNRTKAKFQVDGTSATGQLGSTPCGNAAN